MEGTSGGNRIVRWRVTFLAVLLPVVLAVFVARLFQLQIVEGQSFRDQAYENRIRTISIPSPRGVVYDRNGVLLVRNVPQYNVMITPALLPDSPAEVDAIYQRISALTGVPVDLPGELAAACIPGRGIIQLVEEGSPTARSMPGRWPATSMRPWGACSAKSR